MNLPLVSIVMTSYNRDQWIGQAIESALAQDYPNLEIVISDNCSTDKSDEVIRRYANDPRIRYVRNETNIGMMANFNKVFFELPRGKYLTHLSNDDYLTNPRFISRAVEIFTRNENVTVVFGMHNQINDVTKKISPNPFPKQYDIECRKGKDVFFDFADTPYFSMGGAVYNMECINEHNIRFSGRATGDVEINLQLMLHGNIGFINESVYMIRAHDTNASGSTGGAVQLEDMYLDVYRYIYQKAAPVIEKPLLDNWYHKLIIRNFILCLHAVLPLGSRKQTIIFNKLMWKKYKKKYLWFLATHPKYVAKIILNR